MPSPFLAEQKNSKHIVLAVFCYLPFGFSPWHFSDIGQEAQPHPQELLPCRLARIRKKTIAVTIAATARRTSREPALFAMNVNITLPPFCGSR
jgi:hypothetical protein